MLQDQILALHIHCLCTSVLLLLVIHTMYHLEILRLNSSLGEEFLNETSDRSIYHSNKAVGWHVYEAAMNPYPKCLKAKCL